MLSSEEFEKKMEKEKHDCTVRFNKFSQIKRDLVMNKIDKSTAYHRLCDLVLDWENSKLL